MIKTLKKLFEVRTLNGRNKELTKNRFALSKITNNTALIFTDDCQKYVDFDFFYTFITGDIEFEEKKEKSQIIDYENSPKIVFTSNFAPRRFDESTAARMLVVIFSDWYHESTPKNSYKETRKIRDDFGYDICFGDNYSADYWNEDMNFFCDCVQFYLQMSKQNIKLEPPLEKFYERINRSIMGDAFVDWAEVYFSTENDNLDQEIVRKYAYSLSTQVRK